MSEITFIDLFAGTGGFSSALNDFGCKCVFANDFDKNSHNIYKSNHNDNFVYKNLNDINVKEIPSHNILCGGFPCQPFSIAGKRQGFEDERSNVFWKILEIIEYHKPEIIFLENVKNLKSHDNGQTYKIIEENLSKYGYFIKSSILDTSKITNLPHHRERIYIVCFKDEEKFSKFDFNFSKVKNDPIINFLETKIQDKYYYTDKLKVYDVIKNNINKNIKDCNTLYQFRRHYVRENKSNCCPTLTANMGTGGHNVPLLLDDNGIRKLTPRECFNLQGFPITYILPKDISDSGLYKLAGNAISVPVIKKIFQKIIELLK